jgi:hypothetical protein
MKVQPKALPLVMLINSHHVIYSCCPKAAPIQASSLSLLYQFILKI